MSYAATLALGCIWASRQLAASTQLERVGGILAWLMVLAAVFDALENLALLVQLYRAPEAVWSALAFVCASAKFLIAAVGLTYWFAGVAAWVVIDPVVRLQIVLAVVIAGLLIQVYLGSLPRLSISHSATSLWPWSSSWSTAMVYGQIGTDYGIVSLFWNDHPATRISASLGVTLLLADLGIVAYFAAPELVAALVGPPPWGGTPRTVVQNLGT